MRKKLITDYATAPNQAMVSGLKQYVENGVRPGHFLTALLSNELTETFAHADETNEKLIRQWVQWVYNEMPAHIVGSRKKVEEHLGGNIDCE